MAAGQMLVLSANAPATPLMLVLYALSIVLVLLYSAPVSDTVVRHVLPLQQFRGPNPRTIMMEVLNDVPNAPAAAVAGSGPSNHGVKSNAKTTFSGRCRGQRNDENSLALEAAKQFVWRQRIRAVRHADYMRIETLHFVKLLAAAIPRLRLVWRGEDYCAWEGVTCTALRYPLETLIDVPSILAGRHKRGVGDAMNETLMRGDDGVHLLGGVEEDPVFTLVGVRLRGMNLFGVLQGLRPIGASQLASPMLSSEVATSIMGTQYGRARRKRVKRRPAITSPREPQYWPWEATDMQMYARKQNCTCEMVRYTLRRILRRLELHGERTNHPDLQGFDPVSAHIAAVKEAVSGSGGMGDGVRGSTLQMHPTASTTTPSSSLSSPATPSSQLVMTATSSISRVVHDTLLPPLTRQDIAQTVFGEIEPRLVGIQRFDISYNPGIVVADMLNWSFPYMRTFDIFGTTPLSEAGRKAQE
ncbi:hypothetical protein TraAM80_06088 [Trypanosoma rangeli]|uniref:Uncharacterized protein n=1 Tax=Trypanosoma rangeli TaxID=5698 RepID=A0A3R7KWQ1_TRYRA|nr:uncharacterized protein TraAM80_06088 [Trypanosoma rangeli]RNF02873.1 hypothetical protein TraAM80_06088 [Trypanosoma rangeli]|eukprot:RNF02873.1 hypothetical protein TraAM80_06088 [Trypanosoma rangeli]